MDGISGNHLTQSPEHDGPLAVFGQSFRPQRKRNSDAAAFGDNSLVLRMAYSSRPSPAVRLTRLPLFLATVLLWLPIISCGSPQGSIEVSAFSVESQPRLHAAGDDATLEMLLAAIEEYHSRIDTVSGTFELTWQASSAQTREQRRAHESLFAKSYRYTWRMKPRENKYAMRIEFIDVGTKAVLNATRGAYDGALYTSISEDSNGTKSAGQSAIRRGIQVGCAWDVWGLWLGNYSLPLHQVLRTAESLEYAGTVKIGAVECHELVARNCRTRSGSFEDFTIALDPTEQFLPRRIVTTFQNARQTMYEVLEFADAAVDGRSARTRYPSVARHTTVIGSDTVSEPDIYCRQKEVAINSIVDDSEFRIDFPIGMQVRDERTGRRFLAGVSDDEMATRIAEEAKQSLEDARRAAKAIADGAAKPFWAHPPSLSFWGSWVFAIVTLSALFVALVIRWKSQAR